MKNLETKREPRSPPFFGWVVATTSLAFVVAQLDVSIVNIALPQIAKSYSSGIGILQWIIDAYTVAFAVLMLSAGSLSDLVGSRRIFQLGILVFGAASIGCGLAWSPLSLIGFRIIQGIGAATMIPSSLAILNQAFSHDRAKRARAVAFWTAAGSIAIASGPILGGLLIGFGSWRLIFFVNAPLCVIAIWLSRRLMGDAQATGNKLDWPGQITWMCALTAIIAVIIEWPKFGIKSPFIAGGLLFSACIFVCFLYIEKKIAYPMLPLGLFKSASFNILLLLGAILNGAYYGIVFVLSLYLQNVLHYHALSAGLAFLPLTAGFTIPNLYSAKLINQFGIKRPILIGLLLFIIGFAGLFVAGPKTAYWLLIAPFLLIPSGMGLAVPAMTTGVLASVNKSLSGTASAVLNTTRQAAGAAGVAVFGAMAAGGATNIVHAIFMGIILTVITALAVFSLVVRFLKTSK